jgi:hypothetical protein
VHVNADFCDVWDPSKSEDPDTARSTRSGYCIQYAGCPIYWASRLQGEYTLSSTESEYIALTVSEALRSVIPMMSIIKEMKDGGNKLLSELPRIHCRMFEDNSGATVHKFRPRTKHLAVKWHHFRKHVSTGNISIHKIDTLIQPADTLMKPQKSYSFATASH